MIFCNLQLAYAIKKDSWSEGKCGFKLIQYSALGIPAVTAPIGVNKKIVDQGVTGFLCETEDELVQCFKNIDWQ